ncbi:MAG: glycosyltransferase family 39 protein [Anaerolineae bacterium]|nr:glycosyltransferase family 39 protein [Anaerolineae bacterium]
MSGRQALRWLLAGAIVLWMAFVYASFYLVQDQRPFAAHNLRAVGSHALDVLAAGWILLAGAGMGYQICRWIGIPTGRPGEGVVWGAGIGMGAIAVGVLILGVLGWVTRWTVVGWLSLVTLLSLRGVVAVARELAGLRSHAAPPRGLRAYLLAMLALTALLALAPPLDWDGLFYHLTMPRLWLAQGRIAPVTDAPHQYYPGMMEMLYLSAMAVKGDVAAKLLHFACLPLLTGTVYLIAERSVRRGGGWRAVAVLSSLPMVFVLGGWAYNDLALAYCQLAALGALLNWVEDRTSRWLLLSGAFCGLSLGLKYTAFVCALSIGLLVCWALWRARARWRAWVGALGGLGLSAAAFAAPWYLRNLIMTGNPVYPFAYRLFDGAGWDAWRAAWYARAGSGLGWDLSALLRLPWTLTLGLRDMNFYDGRVGPVYLLALPFLIAWSVAAWRAREESGRATGYAIAFAAGQYAAWVVGVVQSRSLFQSRLLLPALVALCPALALVYDRLSILDTPRLSVRRLIGMSVALVLVGNLSYHALYVVRVAPLGVLVGEETRSAFLERTLGDHYRAMTLVNATLSEDDAVLFLWEPRSYYCERRAQPDPILERWAWLRHRYGDDVDAIGAALAAEGYTHVLLHQAGLDLVRRAQLDPVSDADLAALEALRSAYLAPVGNVGDAYVLYRLAADDPVTQVGQ